MQRIARIAGSFAIVLVAYWVYAHTAVPFIEPSAKDLLRNRTGGNTGPAPEFEEPVYLKELEGLFQPGDWEIDKQKPPMVLDINTKAKLLWQTYKTSNDGRMTLWPCTIVFLYEGPTENDAERLRQSVVVKVPDGAIIKFDRPLDTAQLKFGRPIGGELLGKIRITSGGKQQGPEDDLLIHAQHLVWNGLETTSAYPVDFVWGKSVGSGSGLRIKMTRDPNGAESGPDVFGIELFEMRKIDRLHIDLEQDKSPEVLAAITPASPSRGFNEKVSGKGPLEITCKGAFRFEVPMHVASFEKNVEVKQLNLKGPPNQLLCEKLSMHLAPKGKASAANDSVSTDLELERIEAFGAPATLSAPNPNPRESGYARGEHLAYNLKTKLIELDGGPEVYLQQGPNEIHGKKIRYIPDPSKRADALGRAWVKGPGWLRAIDKDRPDQRLDARWNGELNLSPKDGLQVISLTGGTVLDYTGMGKLSSDTIYFWLKENPDADLAKERRITPVWMMARSNVSLDMISKPEKSNDPTQIIANVDELRVWFEQKKSPNGIRVETKSMAEASRDGSQAQSGEVHQLSADLPISVPPIDTQPRRHSVNRQPVPLLPNMRTPNQPNGSPAPARFQPTNAPPTGPDANSGANNGRILNPYITGVATPANNPPAFTPIASGQVENGGAVLPAGRLQRFVLTGGSVDAKVLYSDGQAQPELASLIIDKNVRLAETQTREPGEKPLVITGDRVLVENAAARKTTADSPQPGNIPPNRPMPGGANPLDRGEYKITVVGQPANVNGHGLNMIGANLNLDLNGNLFTINGPGSMELPMPDNFNGQQIANPGTMTVQWKKEMRFDGLVATFKEEVTADSPGRHLHTQELEVKLQQPINFRDPNLQNQKDRKAASLTCKGGVDLESNELDEKQQRSYIRLYVVDLYYDLQSGMITAGGPGWFNSVRPDDSGALQNQQGLFVPIRAATPTSGMAVNPVVQPQSTHPLMATHILFQGSILGKLTPDMQQITVNDSVRLIYVPTDDWSAMPNPDKTNPGPNEFLVKCGLLNLCSMIHPITKAKYMEIAAECNAVAHGIVANSGSNDAIYIARAMRIGYNTAKDQLILEGDGNTDVHLYRQLQLGAPLDDTAMKKIFYYPKTNTISTEGIQSLQINQLAPIGNKP
jgi:lipopolysaccharide export system protein LptA